MQFKKDKSGKLEKVVKYIIDNYRQDLDCLNFLCVWRYKEKIVEGRLVLAEVSKLSNKNRDVFDYDVLLEVDANCWNDSSKEEKKQLIFHELEHIVIEYEADSTDDKHSKKKKNKLAEKSISKSKRAKEISEDDIEIEESSHSTDNKKPSSITAQQVYENILNSLNRVPLGEPKRDKQDRICFCIVKHNIECSSLTFFISTFFSEIMEFGIPEELEGVRLFLNYAKKKVGIAKNRTLDEKVN